MGCASMGSFPSWVFETDDEPPVAPKVEPKQTFVACTYCGSTVEIPSFATITAPKVLKCPCCAGALDATKVVKPETGKGEVVILKPEKCVSFMDDEPVAPYCAPVRWQDEPASEGFMFMGFGLASLLVTATIWVMLNCF